MSDDFQHKNVAIVALTIGAIVLGIGMLGVVIGFV